jgi:putative FmdB family regulatory protein
MEAIQKMSEDPLKDCPACGEPALKKKISAVAFRLKGGGWYETDFKTGDKKKNLAKDDAPAAQTKTDSSGGDGGKKDSAKKDSGASSTTTTTSKESSSKPKSSGTSSATA